MEGVLVRGRVSCGGRERDYRPKYRAQLVIRFWARNFGTRCCWGCTKEIIIVTSDLIGCHPVKSKASPRVQFASCHSDNTLGHIVLVCGRTINLSQVGKVFGKFYCLKKLPRTKCLSL